MYGFGAIKKPTDSRFENQSAMYIFFILFQTNQIYIYIA